MPIYLFFSIVPLGCFSIFKLYKSFVKKNITKISGLCFNICISLFFFLVKQVCFLLTTTKQLLLSVIEFCLLVR